MENSEQKLPLRFDVKKFPDIRGNLSFLENGQGLDFNMARVYWTYDIPADAERFGRALRCTEEVVIALSGSFDVVTDNGLGGCKRITLSRPWHAVKIPSMTWRSLERFTSGAVVLTIASKPYSEVDYIRDYREFCEQAKQMPPLKNDVADKTHGNPDDSAHDSMDYSRDCIDYHAISNVNSCSLINLKVNRHPGGGALSVVDNSDIKSLFEVNRVYYLYDVPADSERGGHSHFHDNKLMVALAGSFDVVVDDGHRKRRITLNRPYQALFVPSGIWRTIDNFSSGSVCLVLASDLFCEEDYVRDYDEFLKLTKEKFF